MTLLRDRSRESRHPFKAADTLARLLTGSAPSMPRWPSADIEASARRSFQGTAPLFVNIPHRSFQCSRRICRKVSLMSSEAKAGVPPAAFMQRLLDEQRLALKTAENKLRELDQIEVNYLQLKERQVSHFIKFTYRSTNFFLKKFSSFDYNPNPTGLQRYRLDSGTR